jgi:hypothetical protein
MLNDLRRSDRVAARKSSALARLRRAWVFTGVAATVVFVGWSLMAYRAKPQAWAALSSDSRVTVTRGNGFWALQAQSTQPLGLLFFAGALVQPAAYAPLLRSISEEGYYVLLVELPRRGAFGGADGPQVLDRARMSMRQARGVTRWVVAGHSKGGAVAARFVRVGDPALAGLILVGTSHPRDFSLADVQLPVTRIFGSRDTVADVEKLEANRHNLPPSTQMIRIDGGNHSQFGYYGFQPGDWPATITREQQQIATRRAILQALASARAN